MMLKINKTACELNLKARMTMTADSGLYILKHYKLIQVYNSGNDFGNKSCLHDRLLEKVGQDE